MHSTCRDADLDSKAELPAIGELRRGVVQHDSGVDLVQETFSGGWIVRDDGVGVVRTVGLDMVDGGVEPVHDAGCDDSIVIFGPPVVLAGRCYAPVSNLH